MESAPQKHVCGVCNDEWLTEDEYNSHTCPGTGFTPQQPEHLGEEFIAISESAVARGEERRDETVHPAELAETPGPVEPTLVDEVPPVQ